MKGGERINFHSSNLDDEKWEGTPSDYLETGIKLLLFDKIKESITVIANINPREAPYDD